MGLHDTLEEVLRLYEHMVSSADRAEAAAAQMEDYNRRAERMLNEAERLGSLREQALDGTFNRLQQRMDAIYSEGSKWSFLFQLLFVGFFAALFAGVARSLAGWALEALRVWWAG